MQIFLFTSSSTTGNRYARPDIAISTWRQGATGLACNRLPGTPRHARGGPKRSAGACRSTGRWC